MVCVQKVDHNRLTIWHGIYFKVKCITVDKITTFWGYISFDKDSVYIKCNLWNPLYYVYYI